MNNQNFILGYVESCARGSLRYADCGPVWQMGIIAALLVLAIGILTVLRWRAGLQTVPN